jgi:Spy/CpxP family protein refolding chaperone
MKTRTIVFWTLIAALTLTAGLAAAKPGTGQGNGRFADFDRDFEGRGFFGPRMAAALDLTDDQVAAIEALREEHRASLTDKRKDMMRLRNELQGLMLEDDVDEKKVMDLTRKVGDMRTDLKLARTEMRLKVHELLTDEQRDKMMLMKAKHGGPKGGKGRRGCGADCDGRGHRGGGRRI